MCFSQITSAREKPVPSVPSVPFWAKFANYYLKILENSDGRIWVRAAQYQT